MALSNKLKKSKKKKDEDEDEASTPKKKKGTKVAATDDDEEDDDSEETEEDDEEESDDSEDSEDEEDEDTDSEDEEEDSDSDDDEESEDDDEDEAPAKSKKKSKSSGGGISWDTDDAEGGGLPEGRFVLLNPHTRFGAFSNYNEDDNDGGAPMLSIAGVPVDKKGRVVGESMMIHLTAGKRERIIPTDDGTDFQAAPGKEGKVKGLSKSSNAFYFVKSAEDAGLTKEKLRAKGMAIFDGMEVDIARVPQPERPGLVAKEEGEDAFPKTMPSIETIHSFPWESKGKIAREAAQAAFSKKKKGGKSSRPKAEAAEDQDEEDEADLDTKFPKEGKAKTAKAKVKKSSDSDLIEAAEAAILKAASLDKYKKKGLKKDDIYPASFQFVSKHPERKSIMALIESSDFYADDARPWNWDDNLERIILV